MNDTTSGSSILSVLRTIAESYDSKHPLGHEQPAQRLLNNVSKELSNHVPLGFKVGGSGQLNFRLTTTPWIGFLDLDETRVFTRGIYLVYLFSEDLNRVYLSINQGTEKLRTASGKNQRAVEELLKSRAQKIRTQLHPQEKRGVLEAIQLAEKGVRQMSYQAGNIVALEYDTKNFPDPEVIDSDFARFINLYSRVLQIRNDLGIRGEDGFTGDVEQPEVIEVQGLGGFNPKNDSDYLSEIAGRTLIKSRRHETIVREFGAHALNHGFHPTTPHPIDIELHKAGETWLIEVKVVYGNNFANSVRAAIGQLLEYQHFYRPDANLVALFDKAVGAAYVRLLATLNIATIWPENGKWVVHSPTTSNLSPLGY